MRLHLVALLMLTGCSSSDDDPTTVRNGLNACATRNATYTSHCVERSGGLCGPMPDDVFNTDAAGVAKIEATACASVSSDGCTGRGTDCASTAANGCRVSQTYATTFEADGSSAKSVLSIRITCPDGDACLSTYDCTMSRL